MTNLIKVMAAKVDDKVALWERHPDHPNGEVWIVGDGTSHDVALTPGVNSRLKSGVLIRVEGYQEETKGDGKGNFPPTTPVAPPTTPNSFTSEKDDSADWTHESNTAAGDAEVAKSSKPKKN